MKLLTYVLALALVLIVVGMGMVLGAHPDAVWLFWVVVVICVPMVLIVEAGLRRALVAYDRWRW